MMPINPRDMKRMMQGMKQLEADEVIIKQADKTLVIKNPQVTKIDIMGQESYQIIGKAQEIVEEGIKEEDVEMVAEQTGATQEEAKTALESSKGDIAEAILSLKKE